MNKSIAPQIFFVATIIFIGFLLIALLLPTQTNATPNSSTPNLTIPDLKIPIPTMEKFTAISACPGDSTKLCIPWIGQYISGVYKYATGIVGILATVILMFGGVRWLTAGGSAEAVSDAKAWIGASLTGLVLVMCSYLILSTINPDLVNLKPIKLPKIKPIDSTPGCCEYWRDREKNIGACERLTNDQCKRRDGVFKVGNFTCNRDDKCVAMTGFKVGVKNCVGPDRNLLQQTFHSTDLEEICRDNALFRGEKVIDQLSQYISSTDTGGDKAGYCCVTWKFQPNISDQINDASEELLKTLDCIGRKLPLKSQNITINSISDENFRGTKMAECNKASCPKNCAHTCQSCHYGGGRPENKSYAVDLSINNIQPDTLKKVAENCGAKYTKIESNHVHISVAPCPKN